MLRRPRSRFRAGCLRRTWPKRKLRVIANTSDIPPPSRFRFRERAERLARKARKSEKALAAHAGTGVFFQVEDGSAIRAYDILGKNLFRQRDRSTPRDRE